MHILISNDDGYASPGITALAQQLATIATTTIVAPTHNRSGKSSAMTLDRPLRINVYDKGAVYAVDGTPTDCVYLALSSLLKDKRPDIVVAGINRGQNMGDDVLYSGTIAAAIEGRFLGLPALAISLVTDGEAQHWDVASDIARRIVEQVKEAAIPTHTVLNINIPDVSAEQIAGVQATRLGARHLSEPAVEGTDPQGKPVYWVGAVGPEKDAGPGTDFYAVNNNYVSITPLRIDFTDYASVDKISDWAERLEI